MDSADKAAADDGGANVGKGPHRSKGYLESGDQLLASIRETIYGRSLPLATRELLVQRSSLAGLAGVIGASAMVVDQLFAREQIPRWAAGVAPMSVHEAADTVTATA